MAARSSVFLLLFIASLGFSQANLDSVCMADYADTALSVFFTAQDTASDTSLSAYFDSVYTTGTCDSVDIWLVFNLGYYKLPVKFITSKKVDSCTISNTLNPLVLNFFPDSVSGQVPDIIPETTNVCSLVAVEHVSVAKGAPATMLVVASSNPFQTTTVLAYASTAGALPAMGIYDISGRLVRQFPGLRAGKGSVVWDGTNGSGSQVPAGIYVCLLHAGAHTRSIILSKTH